MTMAFGRGVSRALVALTLGLLLTTPLTADDDLKEKAARLQAEAQRVEREILDLDTQATKVGRDQPARAVSLLEEGLARLEVDTVLSEQKKAELKRKLNISLRAYKGRVDDKTAERTALSDARRAEEERRRAEGEKISQGFKSVNQLVAAGKIDEARRQMAEMARQYPGNREVQTREAITQRADTLADMRQVQMLRGDRWVNAFNDVDKSAVLPASDYELPRDWLEKSKRRTEVKMTEQERAIMKALNTVFSPDLKDTPFSEVIDWLQKAMGVSIVADKQALDEAGVKYSDPVNLSVKATGRSILKKVLGDLNLTYVVKDNTIQITTPARAREMTTVRTYYVGDLAGVVDVRWGPLIGRLQAQQNVLMIANMIRSSFDPKSWEPEGPGTIMFDPINMALIIRQTAEVHFMIGTSMR
jgi:hypothetical protein